MKHSIYGSLFRFFMAFSAIASLSACESIIYEDEGDCDPVHIIRFRYDMNMKFADAFPVEVPSVNLYVFDDDENLVKTLSRDVSREEAHDFSMELRGLPPGHYDLYAWCGVKDNDNYRVNIMTDSVRSPYYHTCRIDREEILEMKLGHIRQDIGRMYHGLLVNVDMTADEGKYVHTVKLTKDTNVVRVVLQHLSGSEINKDDFDITISDANGLYNHKNELMPDMDLKYHPWSLKGGIASFHPVDEPDPSTRAQTSMSAVVSELTVGRLMAERNKDVTLTIRNKNNGELIASIPLIDYLLLVKGNYYSEDGRTPMSDQEYLDRQDEYPMTFFLDEKDQWIKTFIYINSWRVVLNDNSIH